MTPDFEELVGGDLPAAERARLLRAHELLRAAGPLPELPPNLEQARVPQPAEVIPFFNQRRSAVYAIAAAAIALVAFGSGYLAGHRGGGFHAARTIRMHGTAAAPDALASIQIGAANGEGNWQMLVRVSNLPQLPEGGYYTIWLTRNGKAIAPCGTFRAHGSTTSVTFTVAYALTRFDGWVVTKWLPGATRVSTVMTT
ncbi:MAG: anti-sigma factor [Gaiellaceae bacterium]